jgi:hypothetical protein
VPDPVPVPPGQSLGFVSGLVSGWKLRLALGSCSAHARGFGLLPVFVFLCTFLRFYVWACVWGFMSGAYVSFYSLGFVSGFVSGWKLRLALGSCSAHARLMLGASDTFPVVKSLCFFVFSCGVIVYKLHTITH